MYQPTKHQKSFYKLDNRGLVDRKEFPPMTPQQAMQFVIARFVFVLEQIELGKEVFDPGGGYICAACICEAIKDCRQCPVKKACESQTFRNYLWERKAYSGQTKRILSMLQRQYKKQFG